MPCAVDHLQGIDLVEVEREFELIADVGDGRSPSRSDNRSVTVALECLSHSGDQRALVTDDRLSFVEVQDGNGSDHRCDDVVALTVCHAADCLTVSHELFLLS